MNILKLMKEAQQMQKNMQDTQARLAEMAVEGKAGGDMVRVIATGDGRISQVKINPSALATGDAELLEDLILAAVNDAIDKSKKMASTELSKVALAGLGDGLGGLFGN